MKSKQRIAELEEQLREAAENLRFANSSLTTIRKRLAESDRKLREITAIVSPPVNVFIGGGGGGGYTVATGTTGEPTGKYTVVTAGEMTFIRTESMDGSPWRGNDNLYYSWTTIIRFGMPKIVAKPVQS